MYEDILVSKQNRVGIISINRPEFSNAFGRDTYREMKHAVETLGSDDEVGAIVITGVGKHFSAGGDIKRFKMLIETKTYIEEASVKLAGEMAASVRKCPKAVIALVNGSAVGAACGLAFASDFRFVGPGSKFVLAFIKMGLSGDTGCIYYLQKLIGVAKTTEMIMTGAPVGGEEAVRLGLATKLVPDESLSKETFAFAEKLAAGPLLAIRRQKELMTQTFFNDLEEYSRLEMKYMVECSRSADFEEAVNAFLEKRPARFIGK